MLEIPSEVPVLKRGTSHRANVIFILGCEDDTFIYMSAEYSAASTGSKVLLREKRRYGEVVVFDTSAPSLD